MDPDPPDRRRHLRFSYRKAAGNATQSKAGDKTAVPVWVRLQRRGDEMIGTSSVDGATWKDVGRIAIADLPDRLFVGIFGCATEPTDGAAFRALQATLCPSIVPDCNGNGIDDALDLSSGTSRDCDVNAVPDECDIGEGRAEDCNRNGVPDGCDIASGSSADLDADGAPDECEGGLAIPGDANGDGGLDVSDGVVILSILFTGGGEVFPCGDGGARHPANVALIDWQPDGAIDLSDAVASLSFLFLGGFPHALHAGVDAKGCVRVAGCSDMCGK